MAGRRRGLLGNVTGWLQLGLFGPAAEPASSPARPRRKGAGGRSRQAAVDAAAPPPPPVQVPRRLRPAVDPPAAERLARDLPRRLGRRRLAGLVLTDNRSVLLSAARETDGAVRMRLHHGFVAAGDEILAAVAAFAGGARGENRRRALAAMRQHIDGLRRDEAALAPRPLPVRPRGEVYDLEAIRDAVTDARFGGKLRPPITWGRWSALRGRRRTIRLGSYDHRDGLIRIHPALDQPWVPAVLLIAVVHHELLHAALPPSESGGRRCLHGAEFRRLERELPQHAEAEAWLAANLSRLLKGRPRARRSRPT